MNQAQRRAEAPGFDGVGAPKRRTLTALALTKNGIISVLDMVQIGKAAARLRDPSFRARVEENKEAAKAAGANLPAMRWQSGSTGGDKRERGAGCVGSESAHGGVAPAALAAAPNSQPLVPQAATGYWNLDGATDVKKDGQLLTKAVAALECETRGIYVKRFWALTKHPGEVHPDEKLAGLVARLKADNNGSALLKKMTDEDGELKTGLQLAWNGAPGGASSCLSPPLPQATAEVTNVV